MGAEGKGEGDQGSASDSPRLMVEESSGRRPFMRGIMVHSLMVRGVGFDDAYRTAEEVRARLGGRAVVAREELAKCVAELLGRDSLGEPASPPPLPASISVTGHSGPTPFSKGVLSQSLLAASLDPNDAFDAARQIELDLVRGGKRKISRKKLRRMAHDTLLARFGQQAAERYLVWRAFQEPLDKPVIILLGGTTGAGKTSLALEVAHRLGISRVLSTDAIRQVMRIMLSPELMPAIHVSSFDAHRHITAPAIGEDPWIEGFMAQASTVSVGVPAMLERAVAENTSLVLDGVAIVPGLIDLEKYAEQAHVIPLIVATLDEAAFRRRFESRGARQGRRGKHRYIENLEAILRIQDYFLEAADRYGVPIVDNVSFDSSVTLVIRHVIDTLRKRCEFDLAGLL